MIGVIIPVHNEEQLLGDCLSAVVAAARYIERGGEAVRIVAVLDACVDGSAAVAARHSVTTLSIQARCVGVARAVGAAHMLAARARWLAFTDADTIVSESWLAAQLQLDCDVVCGTIAVADWGPYGEPMRQHFERTYTDADGHRHVHGANLGVSAQAYRRAGGFAPLTLSEDVALVDALIASGASVAWSAAPRVITSARTDFKVDGGFGATLAAVAGNQ
jgi:glycosyltransferase involved in cell wall biosynthesis